MPNCLGFCGEDGIRTRDPLIENQVLYQLSYIPSLFRAAKILYFLELETASCKKNVPLFPLDFFQTFSDPLHFLILGIEPLPLSI